MEENNIVNSEEIEVIEDAENITETPEETRNWNTGLLAFAGIVGATALIGGLFYKGRGKLDEIRIKKLEKKGYVISKEIINVEDLNEESNEMLDEEAEEVDE